MKSEMQSVMKVALHSGGRDKPYALGLTSALSSEGVEIEFIGGDEFSLPELYTDPRVKFLNLRGDQEPASLRRNVARLLVYYWRLIRYAGTAEPEVFHILWNNKFEIFDRTALLCYYKLLGKKIVFTAHNVNARERDSADSALNRWSLRMQYRLVDHIFVHTDRMKRQLIEQYGGSAEKVTVIPFGVNNTVPNTTLTNEEAKDRLGLERFDKVILFFGNIAPYKGLEILAKAFVELVHQDNAYRLVIAGRPKGSERYWNQCQEQFIDSGVRERVIERIEYVPDEETETFFKAADILVLPYTRIFQSGVLFLAYGFGLPAIVADVGSLRDEIIEDKTGLVFKAGSAVDLATAIRRYFNSDLYKQLDKSRRKIRDYANDRYSWSKVATITTRVYADLLAQ